MRVFVISLTMILGLVVSVYATNKQEIIDDLKGKGFVGALINMNEIGMEADGAKLYRATIREENPATNECEYRSIFIYVINEDTPKEKAFYKYGSKPVQIIKTNVE